MVEGVEVDDAVCANVGGGAEGVHGWVVGAVVLVEAEVVIAWQIGQRHGGREEAHRG